jgi:anti-anti-sigma factor
MAALKLSRQKVQDAPVVVTLRVAGEMGGANGRQAETYFDETLQADKPRHVLLDLGELTFADSAFFSALLFWREEMMKGGGALVLFGLRPEIASTMRLLTLDRVLTVRPDQAAALAALPKP